MGLPFAFWINPIYIPTGYLLEDYSGAAAAYSLRKIANATTSVIKVRRSSDNTEQDFTASEIIDGTLTTFTGAGQINTGAAADLYSGFAILSDPATAGDTNTFIPDQSNDDTIDMGAIEQGWLSGGMITLTSQSATRWHCAAYLLGDATLATPFE